MPTDFPGAVDDIQNDVTNSSALSDLHPSLHNDLADAVMALETQVLAGGGSVADGSITSAKIADGTIQAIDLADGAVTSAKILDGTIATADHADASVTNAKLASDTARANLLTNGGFEVWQRGNGPFITGNYSADRWMVEQGASDTHSVSKDTTNVDSAMGSRASAACTVTRGGSGSTQLSQLLSGSEYDLKNRVVSASVRVRTSTASAVRLAVYDGSGYQYSSFHTGGSTWQTLTVTATMTAGAGFTQIAVNFQASCTAYIDNAMLVVGSVAADYAPLHPADDLHRCQRYYEIVGTVDSGMLMSGYADIAARSFVRRHSYLVQKAVVPTQTKVGTWFTSNTSQPTFSNAAVEEMTMLASASAAGWGQCNNQGYGAGQYAIAEANP